MSTIDKISIQFGIPEHGWLPTVFKFKDFELELDISDVPLNPMNQLCDSLIQLLKGIDEPDIVLWHLEPYCYYLKLKRIGENYKAIILESENYDSPTKLTFEAKGNLKSIVLPIYRSLKNFHSKAYLSPNWDLIESVRIEELKLLIEKEKAHNKR